MELVRRRVCAIALATLSIQRAVLALGAARLCVKGEHTHGGVPAPECPMHHHTDSQPIQHALHVHGSGASAASDDSPRVTCRCSSDPLSIYLGSTGIMPVPVPVSPAIQIMMLAPQNDPSLPELWVTPLSPPPRPTFHLS
jgi:hypothetical protein